MRTNMATFEEIMNKLSEKGLNIGHAMRIESTTGEHLIDNNPASDLVNLFPTLLAASINDLNSLSNSYNKIDVFSSLLIDQLCEDAFNNPEGMDYEKHIMAKLKQLKKSDPELYSKMVEKFFLNVTLGYFIALKFGLRTCPEKVGGKGYFHYFALMDFFDDLEPETQDMIIKDLAHKNLWDVTEEDI